MHSGTGFALPFLLAGETLYPAPITRGRTLTAALQSGKPRRTSRKGSTSQLRSIIRAPGDCGICRIGGGPTYGYTRHNSINFIVCPENISLNPVASSARGINAYIRLIRARVEERIRLLVAISHSLDELLFDDFRTWYTIRCAMNSRLCSG